MRIFQNRIGFYLLLAFCFILNSSLYGQSPVDKHGHLQVSATRITDKNDSIVSFAGMSLFWSNWAGDFYNSSLINWLASDWKCTIVRAAMGIEGNSSGPGYLVDPETEKQKVKSVVDACIDTGIYVLIDWHDHNAQLHTDEASEFFAEMARLYGTYDNVIYEIFNEPLDVSWSQVIKPYAERVIDSIRKYDADNLIIVGTRNWSQMVSEVAANPVTDTNVAYTLHFYVGMHGQWLRDEATKALNAGVPLLVTEWGLWGDDSELDTWIKFMKDNALSNCNWSVTDKVEPSSALNPGASKTGNWTDSDLTLIGKTVRNYITYWDSAFTPEIPEPPCDTLDIPGLLQAEDYCDNSGIQTENCSEGGQNVGYIEAGDWIEFKVFSALDDTVAIEYRIASQTAGGIIELQSITESGTETLHTIDFSATGDWQNWATVRKNAYVPGGNYTLRLVAKKTGFNINWIQIMETPLTNETLIINNLVIYPNPANRTLSINTEINNYKVEIVDVSGRQLIQQSNLSGISTIDISGLNPGVYMIEVDNKKYSRTQLFIKE